MKYLILAIFLTIATGCGMVVVSEDPIDITDIDTIRDRNLPDSSLDPDADILPDGGNLPDSGELPDGNILDTGSIDAEILPDGNTNPDGGSNPDSGTPDVGFDAGKPDAGYDGGSDTGTETWYWGFFDVTFQRNPIVGNFDNYSAGTACHNLGSEWGLPTVELLKSLIFGCDGMNYNCRISTNYCNKFNCNDSWITSCNPCPSFKDRQLEGSYLNTNLHYVDLPVWSSYIYVDEHGWSIYSTTKYDTALFEFKAMGVIPSAIYCMKKGK